MAARKTPGARPAESLQDQQRQQMLGGMEAATLGFTLLGCIGVGWIAGSWLDGRLHATIWTPGGVVVGAVAGFTEMIRTLMKLNRRTSGVYKASGDAAVKLPAQAPLTSRRDSPAAVSQEEPQADVSVARPRIFTVPPPPEPSFKRGVTSKAGVPASRPAAQPAPVEDLDLVERLLSDDHTSSQ